MSEKEVGRSRPADGRAFAASIPNADELERVAYDCERITEPNRELDGAIAKALSPHREWHRFSDTWGARCIHDDVAFDMPDEYSRSLDAAITLVPDDCTWMVRSGPWAKVWLPDPKTYPNDFYAAAATPALALCSAALQAIAMETRRAEK